MSFTVSGCVLYYIANCTVQPIHITITLTKQINCIIFDTIQILNGNSAIFPLLFLFFCFLVEISLKSVMKSVIQQQQKQTSNNYRINKRHQNHVSTCRTSVRQTNRQRIRSIVRSLWNVIVNSLLSGGSIHSFSLNSGALWMSYEGYVRMGCTQHTHRWSTLELLGRKPIIYISKLWSFWFTVSDQTNTWNNISFEPPLPNNEFFYWTRNAITFH